MNIIPTHLNALVIITTAYTRCKAEDFYSKEVETVLCDITKNILEATTTDKKTIKELFQINLGAAEGLGLLGPGEGQKLTRQFNLLIK